MPLLRSVVPIILPHLESRPRAVLDLGCGMRPTVTQLELDADALRVGIDFDVAVRPDVVGDGHMLPFRAGSFDFVLSKVALPYMDIPWVLREIYRVLRPGGRVWMTLHPPRMAVMAARSALFLGHWRVAIHQMYALLNGLVLACFGRVLRAPWGLESVQTVAGIHNALRRSGFSEVTAELRARGTGYERDDDRLGPVFAVSARKPMR